MTTGGTLHDGAHDAADNARNGTARTGTDPRAVLQNFLDTTTGLLHRGETGAYTGHFRLPYIYRTASGSGVVETTGDLHGEADMIVRWLQNSGVTEYHRIVTDARLVDPDTIEGIYRTYALNRTIPVIDPYDSRSVLQRIGGAWLAVLSEHELNDAPFADRIARPAHGHFSGSWTNQSGNVTRDQHEALSLYQSLIDRMTACQIARDLDGWVDQFTMPYNVHYDRADHTVQTPRDVRAFFDGIVELLDEPGVDDMTRRASFAAFVTDDELLGYHETTMTGGGAIRFGPISSRMTFVLTDGTWKCGSVANSLLNEGFPGGAFRPAPQLPTLREIQKRMRK